MATIHKDLHVFEAGIVPIYSVANVSNPPTLGELQTALGTATADRKGVWAIVDDAGAETAPYLCFCTGTKWFYIAGTVGAPS